jgi:hypothetical protein
VRRDKSTLYAMEDRELNIEHTIENIASHRVSATQSTLFDHSLPRDPARLISHQNRRRRAALDPAAWRRQVMAVVDAARPTCAMPPPGGIAFSCTFGLQTGQRPSRARERTPSMKKTGGSELK